MKCETSTFEIQVQEQNISLKFCDWGDKNAFPIVCIHGLTGNSHDFDFIAPALVEQGYRVIAPDLPGRGGSSFLSDPQQYNYELYLSFLNELIKHLGFALVDWLGVSLGGLLGMRVAAEANSPIRNLILNDIGPEVPQEALDFIYQVIKAPYYFDSVAALEERMRATRGLTWGPVSDVQWKHMAEHNGRILLDGRVTYAYDHNIAEVFEREPVGAEDLWLCWGKIQCPILVLQGENSVLLTKDIINKMGACGPRFDLIVFDGCGHVPSLMEKQQITQVCQWLSAAAASGTK